MPWRAEGEFGTRGEDGSSRNRREGSRGKDGRWIHRDAGRESERFRLRDGKVERVNDNGAI